MPARYQKYRLKWPLTPAQVINIDEMLSEIFTDLNKGSIVTKVTTGDPTGYEGLIEINTFDNVVKIYADGAWRAITSTW